MLVPTKHSLQTSVLAQAVPFFTRRENALNSRVSKSWQEAVKQCEEQDQQRLIRLAAEYEKGKSIPGIPITGLGSELGFVTFVLNGRVAFSERNYVKKDVRSRQTVNLHRVENNSLKSVKSFALPIGRFCNSLGHFRVYEGVTQINNTFKEIELHVFDGELNKKECVITLELENPRFSHHTVISFFSKKEKEFYIITSLGYFFLYHLDKGVIDKGKMVVLEKGSGGIDINAVEVIQDVIVLKGRKTASYRGCSFITRYSLTTKNSVSMEIRNDAGEDILLGIAANSQFLYVATWEGVNAYEYKNGDLSSLPTHKWSISSLDGVDQETGVKCKAAMPVFRVYTPLPKPTEDFVMVHVELYTDEPSKKPSPHRQKYVLLHAHNLKPFKVQKSNQGSSSFSENRFSSPITDQFLDKDVVYAKSGNCLTMRHIHDKVPFPDFNFPPGNIIDVVHTKLDSSGRISALGVETKPDLKAERYGIGDMIGNRILDVHTKLDSSGRIRALGLVIKDETKADSHGNSGRKRYLKLISVPEPAKQPKVTPTSSLPKGKQTLPTKTRRWTILLIPAKLYELFKRAIENIIHCIRCKKSIKKV